MSRSYAGLIVLALIVAASPSVAAAEPKKLAFLVGVDKYEKDGLADLNYADDDAEELARILKTLGFEVDFLLRDAATGAAVRDRFAKFIARTRQLTKDDIVLVSLSGHGIEREIDRDGRLVSESFFCPCDAQKSDTDSLISVSQIMHDLIEFSSSSQNLLLIDACRDDPTRGARGLDGGTVKELPAKLSLLFACSSGQRSYESSKVKHGVFTHLILEGLSGKAGDQSGEVTWLDLAGYVQKNVPRRLNDLLDDPHAVQSPNLLGNLVEVPILAKANGPQHGGGIGVVVPPGNVPPGTAVIIPPPADEMPPSFKLTGHPWYVATVAFGPDGTWSASASGYASPVLLWDLKKKKQDAERPHRLNPIALFCLPDNKTVVYVGTGVNPGDGTTVLRYNRVSDNPIGAPLTTQRPASAAALSRDGTRLALAETDRASVWDLKTGGRLNELSLGLKPMSVAFTPAADVLLVGCEDKALRVWNLADDTVQHTLEGHKTGVYFTASTPDGASAWAFALSQYERVGLLTRWNIQTGEQLAVYDLNEGRNDLQSIAISPDGKRALAGSMTGAVGLWDLTSGKKLATYQTHEGAVFCLAFSADGQSALSGGQDFKIQYFGK